MGIGCVASARRIISSPAFRALNTRPLLVSRGCFMRRVLGVVPFVYYMFLVRSLVPPFVCVYGTLHVWTVLCAFGHGSGIVALRVSYLDALEFGGEFMR